MSKRRLPSKLYITCSVNGRPLPNELVCVTIKTNRRNDFPLIFGPTNQNGHITVTREELIGQAMDEKKVAQMDFGDPEYDFTGDIEITPLGLQDIDNALGAYRLFRKAGGYPRNWIRLLKIAKKSLDKLPPNSGIIVEVRQGGIEQVRLRPIDIHIG